MVKKRTYSFFPQHFRFRRNVRLSTFDRRVQALDSRPMNEDYELLDSGDGRKLERFGEVTLVRPAGQVVWRQTLPDAVWRSVSAGFDRKKGNSWHNRQNLPDEWTICVAGIRFKLSSTDFGHLGIFPEQRVMWEWIRETVQKRKEQTGEVNVLNLFAYSGGSTLAAAQGGAAVCHLDASKGMVEWARENAVLNALEEAPIRWIVDDAIAFLRREIKRGKHYDGIILDPPSFGRGKKGEVFKIQTHLPILLDLCRDLLSDRPEFLLLSCHTPEYSPVILQNLLMQWLQKLDGSADCGEMLLTGKDGVIPLPSGAFARWTATG
jgi:23S rRNA (cytosine1962-C5)-methyltransferase